VDIDADTKSVDISYSDSFLQVPFLVTGNGDLDRLIQWHQLSALTDTLLSIQDVQVPSHVQSAPVEHWTGVAEEEGMVLANLDDPDMELFDLLHRRFGHAGYQALLNMVRHGMVEGLGLTAAQIKSLASYRMHASGCVACKLAKMHASHHPTSTHQTTRPLEELHMDVAGQMGKVGRMGELYYLLLVCVHTNAVWGVCFKTRDQVPVLVRQGVLHLQALAKANVAVIRSDGASEFHSKELENILLPMQIIHTFSAPYIHQENGHAERMVQRIDHLARAMLVDSGLHLQFWPDAVIAAVYLHNRMQSRGSGKTPWELLTGEKPDVSGVRVWGCKVMVHVPEELQQGHLGPRAEVGILLGFNEHYPKSWLVLIDGGVYDRGDIAFMEGTSRRHMYDSHMPGVHPSLPAPLPLASSSAGLPPVDVPPRPSTPIPSAFVPRVPSWQDRVMRPRPGAVPSPHVLALVEGMASGDGSTEPANLTAAMAGPDASKWAAACLEEMSGLRAMHTWEVVDRPAHCNVLPLKWVFKLKRHQDGSLDRFKARLCVKGFRQKAGVDFEEIFAPVASASTFRALMAAVAVHSWHVRQVDFKQAFLNGRLQETVFVQQPEGYTDGTPRVMRLLRSLYGLKQAPRAWHETLKAALLGLGYAQSTADPCLFFKAGSWLLLYVDDQLMVGPDLNLLQGVIVMLAAQFDLTDMGDAKFYVGVDIDITPGRVALSQRRYITDLLQRFPNPSKSTGRHVMVPGIVRNADTSMLLPQPCPIYPSIIGSLLHLQVWTRPDISNSTGKLSRRLSCPTQDDLDAAYRILEYLKHTIDLQIVYSASATHLFEAFTDSDYASDALSIPPRRSTSGSVVFMAGGPIIWSSKTQQSVAGSTMEAEYMAANITARDVMWMRHLLPELGFPVTGPLAIQCDSQAGIALVKNPLCTAKAKHIDVIHHYIRERVVEFKELSIQFVAGEENVADIFTKPLAWPEFSVHRHRLLQQPIP
jgi:hypothetical protein